MQPLFVDGACYIVAIVYTYNTYGYEIVSVQVNSFESENQFKLY